MNNRSRCILLILAISLLLVPVAASANTAEPPALIVLCPDGPSDLTVTLELGQGESPRVSHGVKQWEHYFRFYYGIPFNPENAVLRVESGEKSFTCPLPAGMTKSYNNLVTLSYGSQTVSLGQPFWRQPLLIALRVVSTLLLEGLVFFLFGFRQKRSWIVFLVINLLTQGWLNGIISSNAFSNGYWIIGYWLAELVVFIAESVAFPLTLKENKKGRCVLYALTANVVSLVFGGLLLSWLPM